MQQLELERAQFYGSPLDRDLLGERVQAHPARVDHFALLRRALLAAQDGFHPRDELPRAEGFHHVVVSAELETQDAVELLAFGRQKDDRYALQALVPAHALANLQTVQVGKQDVQQDQVCGLIAKMFEPFLAAAEALNVKAFLAQGVAHQLNDVFLVLDNNDPLTHFRIIT